MSEMLMIVGLLNLLVGLLILKYLRRVWLQLLELSAYFGLLSGMNWWCHSVADLKTDNGLRVYPGDGEHAKTDGGLIPSVRDMKPEVSATFNNPIITFGPLNVGDMFNTKSGRWVKQNDEDALCVMSGVHAVGSTWKFKPTDEVVVLYSNAPGGRRGHVFIDEYPPVNWTAVVNPPDAVEAGANAALAEREDPLAKLGREIAEAREKRVLEAIAGVRVGPDCCPSTGEKDCRKCSGEYCENHFDKPCGCDVVQRHRVEPAPPPQEYAKQRECGPTGL